MLYDIRHRTTFSYEESVSVSHHVLHLEPRRHPHQTCVDSETLVDPKAAVDSVGEDYFGNPIRHLTVQRPHKRLVIDARARVEVLPPADGLALEQSAPWESVRDRLAAYEALDAYELVFASPYVALDEAVREYALESFTPQRPILAAA